MDNGVDAINDALREANGKKMRQQPAVDANVEKHGRLSGLNWGYEPRSSALGDPAQTCPNDFVLAAGAEADQCSGGQWQ